MMYTKIKYDVRKANSVIFFLAKNTCKYSQNDRVFHKRCLTKFIKLRFSNAYEGTILFHLYSPSLTSTVAAHFLDL